VRRAYTQISFTGCGTGRMNANVNNEPFICKRKANDCDDTTTPQHARSKLGIFITQLQSGDSFGELSFNADGNHSVRNASVVSDGRRI